MNNYYPYGYMRQQSIPQVNGFEGAKMYQMGINSQVMMLDTELPVCYIKETDGAGYPTIKAYDLVPHKDEQQKTQESILERLARIEERMFDNESTTTKQSESINEQQNTRNATTVPNARNDSSTIGNARM